MRWHMYCRISSTVSSADLANNVLVDCLLWQQRLLSISHSNTKYAAPSLRNPPFFLGGGGGKRGMKDRGHRSTSVKVFL